MADPLVEVTVRVYADFADRGTLAEGLAVVARARNDLDTPARRRCPSWSSGRPDAALEALRRAELGAHASGNALLLDRIADARARWASRQLSLPNRDQPSICAPIERLRGPSMAVPERWLGRGPVTEQPTISRPTDATSRCG